MHVQIASLTHYCLVDHETGALLGFLDAERAHVIDV
jgi:hypothetical protein